MTALEFNEQFDLFYDNAQSQGAPGLSIYDKSVFLTDAQELIVKLHYSGYNPMQTGFEGSENRRKGLDQLLLSHDESNTLTTTIGISPNSKVFSIPEATWYIVWEEIILSSTDPCFKW